MAGWLEGRTDRHRANWTASEKKSVYFEKSKTENWKEKKFELQSWETNEQFVNVSRETWDNKVTKSSGHSGGSIKKNWDMNEILVPEMLKFVFRFGRYIKPLKD